MPLASKTFADIITFTRGSTGTYFDSAGVLQSAAINVPRFDYDPVTLLPRGILIEESRINALANSLLDGTVLSTQNVTVTAAARTLSFYGTGTVTLSGAHSATVVGAGAYPTRTTLTFTPSAGTLTLTVTGTVQYANLETGLFATSFIPTTTATTRSRDVANITTLTPWYGGVAYTLFGQALASTQTTGNQSVANFNDGTLNNRVSLFKQGTAAAGTIISSGVEQYDEGVSAVWPTNTMRKLALAVRAGRQNFAANGALAPTTGVSATLITPSTLTIGSSATGTLVFNGWIQRVVQYSTDISNTDLQAITV